jgi:hypothetical protein
MRTSVVIAVAGVLVLAAGGAYYGHEVYLQRQFRAGLDQTLASLPAGTTATYKDAHYSVLSKQAVVTGLTLHGLIAGPSPQPIEVTIDSIETTNPNLDFARSWADAAAHSAALTSETAFAVADAITVKGVIVHSALISGTTESARIDKLRLYPWALLHAGMPSWTELQASLAPRSEPPTLADLQPLLRAEATVLLALAYDTYEVGAAKFTETLPEIDIAYDVHKMTGSGFDRGVINQAAGEGIIFHGNKIGTLSVDRVTMGATDLRAPMIRLVNGEAASAALLDAIGIGRVEYAGITIQPPDKPSMHVGSFSIGPIAFAKGMPVSGTLAWNDISVPQSLVTDANARQVFTELGLETITTSFALSYDWDIARQHASLHDTMLKVNELGTITIAADLTNVVATTAAWAQARLAHAKLRFEDASLVERLLRMGATMAGTDPAAYRQQIVDLVHQQATTAGGDSPLLVAAGQAAGDFITSPHSLTIELSPKAPVPFIAFMSAAAAPARFAGRVGLAVSANQP